MVNHRRQPINRVILVQSDLISRKFDFCQTPAISILIIGTLPLSPDHPVGRYLRYETNGHVKIQYPFIIGYISVLAIFIGSKLSYPFESS